MLVNENRFWIGKRGSGMCLKRRYGLIQIFGSKKVIVRRPFEVFAAGQVKYAVVVGSSPEIPVISVVPEA
jgi:hypothetical protein